MRKRPVVYADRFTWSHALGVVMAHRDGAVSLMIEWAGVDAELMTDGERADAWSGFYRLLESLESDWCVECHLWRERDAGLAQAYTALGARVERGGALGVRLRREIADHLGRHALANQVALVVLMLPRHRPFWRPARFASDQIRRAEQLLTGSESLLRYLPGARIVPVERYCRRIVQTIDRARHLDQVPRHIDPGFAIADQLVTWAPAEAGAPALKTHLVYLYPDAAPAWALPLASLNIPLHVCQVIRPRPRQPLLAQVERQRRLLAGLSREGRYDGQAEAADDLDAFGRFVQQHNLPLYSSIYLVQFHETDPEWSTCSRTLGDWIEGAGGQVRASGYLQVPYFRIAQPGQGYCSPVFRPDHLWQVGNMMPVQVFNQGDAEPESLRLGRYGQLIGFNQSQKSVQHSFTIAMTGAGKGVDKVATIGETYPLGTDWYIVEIGETYRWIVESFGGTYLQLDPATMSVNPFPRYHETGSGGDALGPVPASATVNALAFLLTDGNTHLTVHESAVAQAALRSMYERPTDGAVAPTLEDFLGHLRLVTPRLAEQTQAARTMAANLESFLATAEGRRFSGGHQVELGAGLCGVDLRLVDQASPRLLKFYLVFLALRFGYMALSNRRRCRVLLDELHKFVAHAPDVVGRLVSELARMGRKEAAAIDLVTQGLGEIEAMDAEVIGAMAFKQFLYRADQWDEIAARVGMPQGALAVWRHFAYPLNESWRPALRGHEGRYFNLHLTFPQLLLDLADTTPEMLDRKQEVARRTPDVQERLALLRPGAGVVK